MTPTAPTVTAPTLTAQDLEPFVAARSVALVGASEDLTKVGGRVLHFLMRYEYAGQLHLVNAKRASLHSLPTLPTIEALPDGVELAILAVPAAAVPGALADCGRRGIGSVIVCASGYAEVGPEGAARQDELVQIAAEHGVRMLGPNCLGTIGVSDALMATSMTGLDQDRFVPRDDGLGFVSQSGAVGAFLFNLAQGQGLGIGTFISTGNEADLTLGSVTSALVQRDGTRGILGYIEGVRDPEAFRSALAAAQEQGIPMAFLKVGTSDQGAQAAQSHTGSLAGEDAVYDGLFAQYGVARAHSFQDLLDLGRIMPLPRARGHRVAIVTISGGAGIVAVDAAATNGLDVPHWDQEWQDRMAAHLPSFATTTNPIDTTGAGILDGGLMRGVLDLCDEHPETDVTVLILGNMERYEDQVTAMLADIHREHTTPLVVVWVGGSGRPATLLAPHGIPTYSDPVAAMRALGFWAHFGARQRERAELSGHPTDNGARPTAALAITNQARSAGRRALDELEAKLLLAAAGLPVVPERAADTPQQALTAAHEFGLGQGEAVVVKLLSDQVAHKTEIGGVALGLTTPEAVTQATERILTIAQEHSLEGAGVTVQPQLRSETELILGMKHDPVLGPVVLLGFGGVLAEVLQDVQIRLAPVTVREAGAMIQGLRHVELLRGFRGRPPVDEATLAHVVADFSRLGVALADDVESMEINPMMVMSAGDVMAADALVLLRPTQGS